MTTNEHREAVKAEISEAIASLQQAQEMLNSVLEYESSSQTNETAIAIGRRINSVEDNMYRAEHHVCYLVIQETPRQKEIVK